MKREEILDKLEQTPVIAAIKDASLLEKCLHCNAQVVFILYGDILGISEVVRQVHEAGKVPIIHMDLVDGLSARDIAVDFIKTNTQAAGIISTKPALIRRAHELELLSVRRFFLLDSMAMSNIHKQLPSELADLVEILPGVMPDQLRHITKETQHNTPLIAGGLINTKEEVLGALNAGAIAVSTTNPEVWNM